jgi:xanthine dehydrogenase YagT iron-sulfur-binding subunit
MAKDDDRKQTPRRGARDVADPLELSETGAGRRRFLCGTGAVATGVAALRFVPALAQPPGTSNAPLSTRASSASRLPVRLTVNNEHYELQLEPRVTLLDALREYVGLTGTKKGCDRGQCGACTVLVEHRRINSCLALAVMYEGKNITTIEGLASATALHPMQAAFIRHDGFQCGFCTPGQICSAIGMLDEAAQGAASAVTGNVRTVTPIVLNDVEIRERMSGNICRCGAYSGIVRAIGETAMRRA